MKLEFAKFLLIVALGTVVSAWSGAALSGAGDGSSEPVRLEVRMLETADLRAEPPASPRL